MNLSSRLKTTVAVLAVLAAIADRPPPSAASTWPRPIPNCSNKSSKVVLTRDGNTTAITMASDYEGEPKGVRGRHSGADLHRAQADRRRRDEDHRPSRWLHSAAAGRISRQRSMRASAHAHGAGFPDEGRGTAGGLVRGNRD